MAYEKVNWDSGDVITQEKLNHMDEGIKKATPNVVVVTIDNQNKWVMNCSYNDIKTMMRETISDDGQNPEYNYYPVFVCIPVEEEYIFGMVILTEHITSGTETFIAHVIAYNGSIVLALPFSANTATTNLEYQP